MPHPTPADLAVDHGVCETLAEVAVLECLAEERFVRGRDDAAVADAAEVFRRVEAERGRVAERAGLLPLPRGTVGLAGVFDDADALLRGDRPEGIHVGTLAEEVYRDHGGRFWGERPRDGNGIEREGDRIDVREDRHGAEVERRERGCGEREGRHDDLVTRFHAGGLQCEDERVGAGGDTGRVRDADIGRVLRLEFPERRAEDVRAARVDLLDRLQDGAAKRIVLAFDVEVRELHGRGLILPRHFSPSFRGIL